MATRKNKLTAQEKRLIRAGLENQAYILYICLQDTMRVLEDGRFEDLRKLHWADMVSTAGDMQRLAEDLRDMKERI